MSDITQLNTIGELRASGYQTKSVKEEMRDNLVKMLKEDAALFPGIVGYDDTVIPQLENALLSGQDIVLLGERGQAKTRLARSLIYFLDEYVPAIAGCEINDDPFHPICKACLMRIAEDGDTTPIIWLSRSQRYSEKLATPDITISDLIGEIDPIKVAEGRYLSDELTIHYGLIPRTHRGIFCLNELPDLTERIQVGLLNILEERDVQIRGYKIQLPLDIFMVASANPEDYTNRGRIITPLKDRMGSEIRTHYPQTLEEEIQIIDAEAVHPKINGIEIMYPQYMKEIVAEITHQARKSPEISQKSGVSVRVSITNAENVASNAVRRALRNNEKRAVPRISDLNSVIASTAGKIELDTFGEIREDKIVSKLVRSAVLHVFSKYFDGSEFDQLLAGFEKGLHVQVSENQKSMDYVSQLSQIGGLRAAVDKLSAHGAPETVAAAVEFILEGLHLNRKLNKNIIDGSVNYQKR